jgi:hypothetical protein
MNFFSFLHFFSIIFSFFHSFMSSFHKDSIIQKRISLENNTIGNAISVALENVHTPLKSTEQEIQSKAIRGINLYITYK